LDVESKRGLIDKTCHELSVIRQCELIELTRSSYYFREKTLSDKDNEIMKKMDEIFTEHPYYGTRRMMHAMKTVGYDIGRKKIRSYYKVLGIELDFGQKILCGA